MYLCAEGSCNALYSMQALPWDCIWLMGETFIVPKELVNTTALFVWLRHPSA